MVAAEHVGLVVCEARAVEAEVVSPSAVRVGFTHSVMSGEGCGFVEDKIDVKLTEKCQTSSVLADRHTNVTRDLLR